MEECKGVLRDLFTACFFDKVWLLAGITSSPFQQAAAMTDRKLSPILIDYYDVDPAFKS